MVNPELLKYYELLVRDQGQIELQENSHTRAFVNELRDLWEKRVILRELRFRAGIPVCSGEIDCVDDPTSQCMHGLHPTCSNHTDCCFLCDLPTTLSLDEARVRLIRRPDS
jgi:hypothetical protein